jgi:hypothetical protein
VLSNLPGTPERARQELSLHLAPGRSPDRHPRLLVGGAPRLHRSSSRVGGTGGQRRPALRRVLPAVGPAPGGGPLRRSPDRGRGDFPSRGAGG